MAIVTLRYWAAAKDAAGIAEETVRADTLAQALAAAVAGAGAGAAASSRSQRLRAVLDRSSFLVDGQPAGGRAPQSVELADGAVVEVLPPFAGG